MATAGTTQVKTIKQSHMKQFQFSYKQETREVNKRNMLE